jgi:hypothetical protein
VSKLLPDVGTLTIILIVASVMLGAGVLAIVVWFGYSSYLNRVERRLARRKGVYRQLVAELATRERALLEPEIHRTFWVFEYLGPLVELTTPSFSSWSSWSSCWATDLSTTSTSGPSCSPRWATAC